MMKILVLSDSHTSVDRMKYAYGQAAPDAVLHLGDHFADAQKLMAWAPPGAAYHMVNGNCDPNPYTETEKLLTCEGVKIYMTHGHIYDVKNGTSSFVKRALELGADLALHGHTHQGKISTIPGLTFMCPGQMERHDSRLASSFGIVTISDGKFECHIEALPL